MGKLGVWVIITLKDCRLQGKRMRPSLSMALGLR